MAACGSTVNTALHYSQLKDFPLLYFYTSNGVSGAGIENERLVIPGGGFRGRRASRSALSNDLNLDHERTGFCA